ncbi:unnamed protein product [Macrosiphum euphorbiae]|uniref:Uncharacterized protein n=1 Tax=Macrosiphum euphorbiae TaxID=13131 RepID=A0AAV0VSC0_9HEMI|nr:unnamed protein product [Macrosiphum euphorbiae]
MIAGLHTFYFRQSVSLYDWFRSPQSLHHMKKCKYMAGITKWSGMMVKISFKHSLHVGAVRTIGVRSRIILPAFFPALQILFSSTARLELSLEILISLYMSDWEEREREREKYKTDVFCRSPAPILTLYTYYIYIYLRRQSYLFERGADRATEPMSADRE